MEHVDWLDPDKIILANSKMSQVEFTKDMMSKKYKNLRLLKSNGDNLIRYTIGDQIKWFICSIITIRNGDYYMSIKEVLIIENYENLYKLFKRDELLTQLLK